MALKCFKFLDKFKNQGSWNRQLLLVFGYESKSANERHEGETSRAA